MLKLYVTGVEQKNDKKYLTTGFAITMQSLGYSTGVYKPVEVGGIEDKENYLISNDLTFLKLHDSHIKTYFTYLLKDEISPILSGAKEKIIIEKNIIVRDYQAIKNDNECLIVDGLWGLATPYGKNFLEEDVIKVLELPLLLTISAENANLNNALLSINRAKDLGLKLRGVVVNNYDESSVSQKLIPKILEEYTDAKVLGTLPKINQEIQSSDLITEILNGVNIEQVFDLKIAKLK
jgi:dethiobiotin synthetase